MSGICLKYMVMSDLNGFSGGISGAFFQHSGAIPALEAGVQIAGWMSVTVWRRGQVNKPLFSF